MQYYQVDALSTFYRNLQHDYIEISGIFKVREKETRFVGLLKSGGFTECQRFILLNISNYV